MCLKRLYKKLAEVEERYDREKHRYFNRRAKLLTILQDSVLAKKAKKIKKPVCFK